MLQILFCLLGGQPLEANPADGSPVSPTSGGQNQAAGSNDLPSRDGNNRAVQTNLESTQEISQPLVQSGTKQELLAETPSPQAKKKVGPPFWIMPKNDASNNELMVLYQRVFFDYTH